MKTALYIGNFSFPYGNASGKRVYANGKVLQELGYKVIFIGVSRETNFHSSLKSTKNIYDGFEHYSFPYPKRSIDWVNYTSIFMELKRFLEEEDIVSSLDLVIYYGSPTLSIFNTKLINYCKRNKIQIVTDCVDWLTTKTYNPIFDMIKWADNTFQKAYANKKANGVIAISKYLEDYYKKNSKQTVILPPLSPIATDTQELIAINSKRVDNKKIITYAGIPFRKGELIKNVNLLKDRIDKTIVLLHKVKESGYDFLFNIYGFTKEEYLEVLPTQKEYVDALGDSLRFYGYRTSEQVLQHIYESDFTILIRDVNRDTTAGFPTKVSESISCGVPVITTRTSDLENYIVDGETGFFIDFNEKKAIEELKAILSIDNQSLVRMKYNCAQSQMFYYKNYIAILRDFLNSMARKD